MRPVRPGRLRLARRDSRDCCVRRRRIRPEIVPAFRRAVPLAHRRRKVYVQFCGVRTFSPRTGFHYWTAGEREAGAVAHIPRQVIVIATVRTLSKGHQYILGHARQVPSLLISIQK